MRTISRIDAEIARLKAEKRALKPVISIGPQFKRSRSFRPSGEGQRQPRERDNGYLAFLRRQPCRIGLVRPGTCVGPVEACHVRYGDAARGKVNPGLQCKPADKWATSCCAGHHREQHAAGNERAWWERYGLDGLDQAERQFAEYQRGSHADLG